MARVEIPLIGPSWTNREKSLSAQKAVNMWPEINQEARNVVCLHNTAGLKTFATLEGVDRGMHEFNNLLYVVNGQSLYSIDADGVNRNLGTIEGTGRCVMANDSQQLIIVTGDTPYRYTPAGGVEAITDPDLTKPTSVAYLNSQFVFDNNNGTWGEFVTSSIEAGLSIDALDFATTEAHPDDIIRVISWRQLIYFFGSHSIEPWQNTGVGNPPFARLNSGVQPYGLAGTHAICKTNEYMYFLDNKRIPRRSNGLDFPAIGNPSLGVEFAKYSKIDDCIAFEFVQDNQQFVAFTFPTSDKTWCFHEQSGSWFQLSYGIKGERHRASSMINVYGLNYCADHTNGKIYEYSLDIYDDDGESIIKQRDTAVIHGGLYDVPGKKLFFDEVEFVIASGKTEVAGTGPGPQKPVEGVTGLCATSLDLDRGDLLSVVEIGTTYTDPVAFPVIDNITSDGIVMNDTKVVGFTFFFTKISEPNIGNPAYVMSVYNSSGGYLCFGIYMDDSGEIIITARNSSGTVILDCAISNNGASFADGNLHGIAGVIDLSDEARREIWHNGTDITSSVTWTTYTNDTIQLAEVVPTVSMQYTFGIAPAGSSTTFNTPETIPPSTDADQGLGFCSFDDACTLVPGAVWDNNGRVRDPQKWSGWYASQPMFFYGPTFWRNTGRSEPASYKANKTELDWSVSYQPGDGGFFKIGTAGRRINSGIGGDVEAVGGEFIYPNPSTEETVEIVSPYWENTGNWINTSNLAQDTFSNVFGVEVDGADINSTYTVNKAMLVNTSDSGNRMRIEDSFVCANAAIYVCEQDGTVVDSMVYSGVTSGDSVLIPTGADYYVVVVSDTGQAKVSKWDVTPNTETVDVTGSTPWSAFASGYDFGDIDRVSTSNYTIPAGGISFRFTVPNTTDPVRVGFSTTELNGTPYGNIQHSISTTVGDYTGLVNNSGRSDSLTCGINVSGTDATLVPGQTYFWNLRYASGAGIVFLNHSYTVLSV